jgi:hypothetical protein
MAKTVPGKSRPLPTRETEEHHIRFLEVRQKKISGAFRLNNSGTGSGAV